MFERIVSVAEIEAALTAPVVVEEYPDDTPYPSRLVLGLAGTRALHLVVGGPTAQGDTVVVTLYEPDPAQWEPGFTKRRPTP
jgi:hypothetical protein